MLQKLAPLVDAGRSRTEDKLAQKSKIKKIPLNPEARKAQKLMDQSPLTLLLGFGSVIALVIWL